MQLGLEHKEEHCLSGKPFLRTHLYVALIFQDFPKTYTLSIKACIIRLLLSHKENINQKTRYLYINH